MSETEGKREENEEIKYKENFMTESNLIELSDYKRNVIFIVLVIVSILSSCDGGIIPQQNSGIKLHFKEGDDESEKRVGLFGSIDYIGRIVGSLIFIIIMGKMNRKMMLIVTLLFKAVTLFVPLAFYDYYINTVARCLSGISQVFYPTYLPVWCDQYAKKKKRAIWVTLVQIGNPLGIIIGYGLGMICGIAENDNDKEKRIGWRIAFPIEGVTLVICAVIIFFFDKIYFSEKFVLVDDYKGKEEELPEEKKHVSIFTNVGKILSNQIFLFCSLCNSVAFFGIGVVQYFGDKYMKLVLNIGDSTRFILFGLLCLFGPTTGMVVGGVITSKLGGYIKRRSMAFVIICSAISASISMLIAIRKNSFLFGITGWTYLFAIGGIIPPISGIIISCLDNNLRGDGFSLCNFLTNLLGNFPSSYVYSLLVDAFAPDDDKGKEEKDQSVDKYMYAWMITMGYNFVGLLFVIIGGIFRFRIEGDLSETKNEDEKEDQVTSGNEIVKEGKYENY
jgi:MFS family permease